MLYLSGVLIVVVTSQSGMVARTHKPVLYKPDNTLITSDHNNEKKFMFISQETKPDYREVAVTEVTTTTTTTEKEKSTETYGSRFRKIQQAWGSMTTQATTNNNSNGVIMCDIVTAHRLPTATYFTPETEKKVEIIELLPEEPNTEVELRKVIDTLMEEVKALKERIKELETEKEQQKARSEGSIGHLVSKFGGH